jgi:outer membrane biosynthesis protein TonB
MKENNKNRKGPTSDFERYVRGEMSNREENTFQRRLQKDPFSDEAANGFSEITTEEADEDLGRLGRKLTERIQPAQRMIFYRIAASVAVLLVISSVYLFVLRERPGNRESNITVTTTQEDQMLDSGRSAEPMLAEAENPVIPARQESVVTVAENTPEPVSGAETDNIPVADASETEKNTEETASETASENTAQREQSDNEMNMAETSPQASDKMVMTEYGSTENARAAVTKTAIAQPEEPAAYSPPVPVEGNERYRQYIENNQRKPVTLNEGEQVVVIVSFKVLSTGAIDSIKAIESPGDEYSEEAIRLIREGPSWSPAMNNGEKIDEEMSLRVIFR